MSNNLDLRREIILDHYENPSAFIKNKSTVKGYKSAHKDSASCIDDLTAYVNIKNNKVNDVKFSGIGCAISTSSTDIMANLLKNKTVKDANKIINNYLGMIDGKPYDKKLLKELYVFEDLNKQLNRINCGKVGIIAIEQALNKK
ncbi:MAG: iron-sulfur cluster assembly scaffold protein [Mycoplasmataceae bacterium]|jgi:nitrogen fixation NifU-like protein|nr:iron-sulfur cluster assembly scaffold protein [Mycoplasmataceae bacterium]